MPVQPTYPGVYVYEKPSETHTTTGVSTSVTAFIGRTLRGTTNKPITVNNFADFQRTFGGLWVNNLLGYTVRDFFTNGGSQAIIVRVADTTTLSALSTVPATSDSTFGLSLVAAKSGAAGNKITYAITNINPTAKTFDLTITDTTTEETKAKPESYTGLTIETINAKLSSSKLVNLVTPPSTLPTATTTPTLLTGGSNTPASNPLFTAANPGAWGNNLQVSVNYNVSSDIAFNYGLDITDLFNLTITDTGTGAVEQFNNVTFVTTPPNPGQVNNVLKQSKLVNIKTLPNDTTRPLNTTFQFARGNDGAILTSAEILGKAVDKTGLYALDQDGTDFFSLLCIPGYTNSYDLEDDVITAAAAFCYDKKVFFLIDAPSNWTDVSSAKAGVNQLITTISSKYAINCAVFFPRIQQADPLKKNQINTFVPCGMIAGTMANIDAQRGVWKAPAGLEASLAGVSRLTVPLTDAENGELNPIAINCLRSMPASGTVIWGSRTLQGNDVLGSSWKYISVRRFALYIEQSVYQSTHWVLFEPNDEPLWRQITLSIGSFMNNLFRQGAFQGKTTKEAYFVKCDSETTTQDDINNGIVNIQIGFAPLKPAEFVMISIQQIAGQN